MPRTLADYRRVEGEATGTTLTVRSEGDVDIMEFWQTTDPVYELTLSGRLPPQDWSISLSAAFEGSLSVGLGERL